MGVVKWTAQWDRTVVQVPLRMDKKMNKHHSVRVGCPMDVPFRHPLDVWDNPK